MSPPIQGPGRCAPTTPGVHPNEPASVEPGSQDYYKQRLADFKLRNPCMDPPDYYMGYGQKYMERFTSLDGTDLSAEGLAWRDRTTKALQQKIEDYRIRDPQGFAELERDPAKFREFAFATHPEAYVESGLFGLSAHDLTVIAATPDLKDVLSSEGIKQTLITVGKLKPQDLPGIVVDTAKQYVHDIGPLAFVPPWLPVVGPTGAGPLGPVSVVTGVVTQGERLFDRLIHQG